MSWFINGEPVNPTFLKKYDRVYTGREGLETSILGLDFKVTGRHFRRGDMKLKVSLLIVEEIENIVLHFSGSFFSV